MTEPNTDRSFTYRAFISYSHADQVWADWLHKALETYRVPSRLVRKQTACGKRHPSDRSIQRYYAMAQTARAARNWQCKCGAHSGAERTQHTGTAVSK